MKRRRGNDHGDATAAVVATPLRGGLAALLERPTPKDDESVRVARRRRAAPATSAAAAASAAADATRAPTRGGGGRVPRARKGRRAAGRGAKRGAAARKVGTAAALGDGGAEDSDDDDDDDERRDIDADMYQMRMSGRRREQHAIIERATATASDATSAAGTGRADAFRRASAAAAAHVAVRSARGTLGDGATGGDDDAAAAAVADRSRTLDEFIAERHRAAVEHDHQRALVRDALADVDHALAAFRRTAANVGEYKQLVERREMLATQLIALDQRVTVTAAGAQGGAVGAAASAVTAMYHRVGEFALYEATTGSAPAPGDTLDALDARRRAQLRVDDAALGADAHANARLPRHAPVTFGAPVLRAADDDRMRAALRATVAHTAPSAAAALDDEVARAFARDLCADVARHAALDAYGVVAHVVAPRSCGRIAAATAAPGGGGGCGGGGGVEAAPSARDAHPELYDPMLTAVQRKRIDIKLKASRGTHNAAMSNYFSIARGAPTQRADAAHVPLVNYMGARHCTQPTAPSVRYDDPACAACGGALEIDFRTGAETCAQCHATTHSGVARPLHALHNPTQSKFEYLQSGHMAMLLKRFQGLESTVIPRKKVLEPVLLCLHEQNVPLRSVTVFKIRAVLRRLGLTKWYEHVHQLHHIITGKRPHRFTPLQVQQFLGAFECLIEPYERHRPPNNDNFVYYYYALHKLAQLLGHPPSVVNAFPVLKNKAKHREKERIWAKMMDDLDWPYISS